MKKLLFVGVLYFASSIACIGQRYFDHRNNSFYSAINEYSSKSSKEFKILERIYHQARLFPEFSSGFISLVTDDTIRSLKLQYDIESHQLMTSLNGKYTNGYHSIDEIVYVGTEYSLLFNPINLGYEPDVEKDKIEGLTEILAVTKDNTYIIGRYASAYFQRSNYNPVLQTGDEEDKYIIETTNYLFYDKKYYKLPKSSSGIRKLLKNEFDIAVDKSLDLTKAPNLSSALEKE